MKLLLFVFVLLISSCSCSKTKNIVDDTIAVVKDVEKLAVDVGE